MDVLDYYDFEKRKRMIADFKRHKDMLETVKDEKKKLQMDILILLYGMDLTSGDLTDDYAKFTVNSLIDFLSIGNIKQYEISLNVFKKHLNEKYKYDIYSRKLLELLLSIKDNNLKEVKYEYELYKSLLEESGIIANKDFIGNVLDNICSERIVKKDKLILKILIEILKKEDNDLELVENINKYMENFINGENDLELLEKIIDNTECKTCTKELIKVIKKIKSGANIKVVKSEYKEIVN